jgi:predicted RNA binding protein YcfA (HicA-like mRNA interferase family)
MPKWKPCKRRDFIKKLKRLGFVSPEPGGNHFYMRYGSYTFTVPSNQEYSVPQLKTVLKEIEQGIKREITLGEWDHL